ncbi:hypothetical protein PINS_up002383 [Pythium insidiosum]|nr:hypothetical protein PINS_up002383 [Pythium insidiosum]
MASQEWFLREKERLEEELREAMHEAVSNVQILTQNLEHLNDVGREVVNVSTTWVKFLKQVKTTQPSDTRR